ncbi:GAF domain-containing protein [Roseomonas nepalensis]|uniref:histidine kinase n=1 Tax=Muricoccus nepalensis TaxID=1854500 RepID=A0A502FCD2_9PROT|nr:GAF domain-containing sensor histidine kinase [Roseomonas nepalensis]TPG47067.1 GAF domain-containing protein [Roseomonas nepalensis]
MNTSPPPRAGEWPPERPGEGAPAEGREGDPLAPPAPLSIAAEPAPRPLADSLPPALAADVQAIGRIEAVPTILDVICRMTGMRFAAVARVTEERWVACETLDKAGLGLKPGDELAIATTFCQGIVETGTPVVFGNAPEDPAYRDHPVPALYGFQSYVSVPITLRDGRRFGTLCALDPSPRRVDGPETLGMFRLFAELIAAQLAADDELRRARAELTEQRELAVLREQFIAVLGHDLRNPVASIASGARLLGRSVTDETGRKVLALMQSSILRVGGLINNLMDFARARLGEGLELDRRGADPLAPVLESTIDELRSIHPGRQIEARLAIDEPVPADGPRIAQLLSNLLGNALTHGDAASPVRIEATTEGGVFELRVANAGRPIPADALPGLFQPFFRGSVRPNQQGLGLGLFIASEIARVHGGTLEAESGPSETRFTFRMPLPPRD